MFSASDRRDVEVAGADVRVVVAGGMMAGAAGAMVAGSAGRKDAVAGSGRCRPRIVRAEEPKTPSCNVLPQAVAVVAAEVLPAGQ